jgi:TonB family protein
MRSPAWTIGLASACVLASLACVAQTPKVQYAEGQLLVLVAPDYPPEAVKKGETGSVIVDGKVKVDGRFDNPTLTVSPPSAALEDAVRGVLKYWRMQPRLDRDCTFRETQARVTIWFDIDAGTPKVSYSRSLAPAPDPALVEQMQQRYEILSRREPVYPWNVSRNPNAPGVAPQVAYVRVGPDGLVRNVRVAPKRYFGEFEEELVWSLKQWRFTPSAKGLCAEIPIDFRLN